MKVFSILFSSQLQPGKQSLISVACNTSEEAYAAATETVKKSYGDFLWTPTLATIIDSKVNGVDAVTVAEPIKEDKNWLLKTIVDNKDKTLFMAAERYMSQPEISFIKDKTDWIK